jgi:DNA ligase D-like protein (predicted ligase)
MLATLVAHPFTDPGWLYERKLDGERTLAVRRGTDVRLYSRNELDISSQYPEVVAALEAQRRRDLVIDGEVVAFDPNDQTSFALLQRRMHVAHPSPSLLSSVPVVYFVFDVLVAGGKDLRSLGTLDRKERLRSLLVFADPLRFTEHRLGDGEGFYAEACRSGWEGLIAKRADAPYRPGRSKDWLKLKCVNEQEFVIGGFTEPKGSRVGFGALLLGYFEGDELRYGGKVGTGFDRATLRELTTRLRAIERDGKPFTGLGVPRKGVHFVDPVLVAQIAFSEWTPDGQLRHPRFLGIRQDKAAREVVRERPATDA